MNEDDDNPIDRKLLRRMFKATSIWEELQNRQLKQIQFLEKFIEYKDVEKLGNRERRVRDEDGMIETFDGGLRTYRLQCIGTAIKKALIDGTNKLLERVSIIHTFHTIELIVNESL